ncbi:MAG: 4-(cytidine 5'-diphospho)-2-C-methyl-D-erythritol kinase [Candidatus Tectimicrobiota bacterium]
MRTLHLRAPAKINVYLRLIGRRADGYHLLDSLMVPIDLYDEITLTATRLPSSATASDIVVTCDDPSIPSDRTNLAYQAAALLCHASHVQASIAIQLHKRIPAGAGLGGGSSDAAAVLQGLQTLLELNVSPAALHALGTRLGADVPFFFTCRPAQIAGIGELVTPVAALPQRWIVLVVPPFRVSTPWAYRRFDELPVVPAAHGSSWQSLPGQWPTPAQLVNDLERAVCPAYPQITALKEALLQLGAAGALMSGSGSAVFGLFVEPATAAAAVAALQHRGWAGARVVCNL